MTTPDSFSTTLRSAVAIIMRRSMQNYARYIKENGLSMSQMSALFYLYRKGSRGVSDIGEEMGVTSAAASQMLDKLVLQGLITRSEDPHDRRLKQIVLTDKGCQSLDHLREGLHAHHSWLDELAAKLTPAEQVQVEAALQILIEKAGQLEERPVFETG
jgi:DNA-binding MarR family transcriptional regulator